MYYITALLPGRRKQTNMEAEGGISYCCLLLSKSAKYKKAWKRKHDACCVRKVSRCLKHGENSWRALHLSGNYYPYTAVRDLLRLGCLACKRPVSPTDEAALQACLTYRPGFQKMLKVPVELWSVPMVTTGLFVSHTSSDSVVWCRTQPLL